MRQLDYETPGPKPPSWWSRWWSSWAGGAVGTLAAAVLCILGAGFVIARRDAPGGTRPTTSTSCLTCRGLAENFTGAGDPCDVADVRVWLAGKGVREEEGDWRLV